MYNYAYIYIRTYMCTVIGNIYKWLGMLPYVHMYLRIPCVYYISTIMPATCREWPVLVLAPVHQTHVITRHETPLVCLHASTVPEEGRSVHQTLNLQAYIHVRARKKVYPASLLMV